MTKGIRVIWPDENGDIDEIEYFCGIDVDNLDSIPAFSSVRADWPRYEGGTRVDYTIDVGIERPRGGEVNLVVDYHEAKNPKLAERYDIHWGTNTIVLKQGYRTGHCRWLRLGTKRPEKVRWEASGLGQSQDRPLDRYWRSRRYAQFRKIILAADSLSCVITGEQTLESLKSAHLVPAKNGENDISCNGIALRADLHRLFDAGLFTFGNSGKVKMGAATSSSFDAYRQLLRNRRLPKATLASVKATLALPQFQERLCAKPDPTTSPRAPS